MSRPNLLLRSRTGLGRCAYCHDALGESALGCPVCRTRLHDECATFLPACPTLGCRGVVRPKRFPTRRVGALILGCLVFSTPLLVKFTSPVTTFPHVTGMTEISRASSRGTPGVERRSPVDVEVELVPVRRLYWLGKRHYEAGIQQEGLAAFSELRDARDAFEEASRTIQRVRAGLDREPSGDSTDFVSDEARSASLESIDELEVRVNQLLIMCRKALGTAPYSLPRVAIL